MNITPQVNQLPLATVVNPQTDSLRRDNHQREVITQPSAVNPSLAEQKVASEKDKVKTPGQLNEQIDFAHLEKSAAQAKETINDKGSEQHSDPNHNHQYEQAQGEENPTEENANSSTENQDETKQTAEQQAVEQKIISQMKSRDAEVRIHEQAHASVGGSFTGSPSYSYETGPDGKRYIVDGEVSVDLSKIPNDPQATIIKMRKVHSAALAPAEPSSQDRKVAQRANSAILEAQSELRAEQSGMRESKRYANGSPNTTFNQESQTEGNLNSKVANDNTNDFDQFINETLASQDAIAPSQEKLFSQRASVIESRYSNIGNAYQQPPRSQFEITA